MHPSHPPSRSVEKLSSTKPVPGARKVGGRCYKASALNCHLCNPKQCQESLSLPTVMEHSLHPPTCHGWPPPVQRFGCRQGQHQVNLVGDSYCRVQRLGKWLVHGSVSSLPGDWCRCCGQGPLSQAPRGYNTWTESCYGLPHVETRRWLALKLLHGYVELRQGDSDSWWHLWSQRCDYFCYYFWFWYHNLL